MIQATFEELDSAWKEFVDIEPYNIAWLEADAPKELDKLTEGIVVTPKDSVMPIMTSNRSFLNIGDFSVTLKNPQSTTYKQEKLRTKELELFKDRHSYVSLSALKRVLQIADVIKYLCDYYPVVKDYESLFTDPVVKSCDLDFSLTTTEGTVKLTDMGAAFSNYLFKSDDEANQVGSQILITSNGLFKFKGEHTLIADDLIALGQFTKKFEKVWTASNGNPIKVRKELSNYYGMKEETTYENY